MRKGEESAKALTAWTAKALAASIFNSMVMDFEIDVS